jgi:hypothetical protein
MRVKFSNDDDDDDGSNPAANLILQESPKTRPFSILDRDGRVCGGGWAHWGKLDALASIILMSWAAPSSVSANISSRDGLELQEPYLRTTQHNSKDGEEVLGEWHEWEFLNVLIVEDTSGESSLHRSTESGPLTGICERRGVGVIHIAALNRPHLRDRDIILF